MRIYFAGLPGGNQRDGEQRIIRMEGHLRLASFYYLKQLIITMEEIFDENIFSRDTRHHIKRRTIDKVIQTPTS